MIFSEGSGLNDSIYGKSQAPIRLFLEQRGEAFEQTSVIKHLFNMQKSKNFGEKATSMTAMSGFQPVGENGAYPEDSMQEGYSKLLVHMTWKDKFAISREMVEDAKLMDMKKRPAEFVTAYYRTREQFGAALFGAAIGGQTSTRFKGANFDVSSADDCALFYASHPSKVTDKTQSNLFKDALSDVTIGKMETKMHLFEGDNGEILDVTPDTIIIPDDYTMKKTLFAALGADKDPTTSNNGANYLFGRWNIIVWPYLNKYMTGGNTPWIMMDSKYNETYGGALWYDRTELEVRSTLDEDTDANVWRGYSRYTAGFNDWRFACCGGITTASTL